MIMEFPPDRIRIEDQELMVALDSADFDERIGKLVPENELRELPAPIDRLVCIRGDLPKRHLWKEIIWWALGILAGAVFFYGLYALLQDAAAIFLRS